jgi:hypothetical protein
MIERSWLRGLMSAAGNWFAAQLFFMGGPVVPVIDIYSIRV